MNDCTSVSLNMPGTGLNRGFLSLVVLAAAWSWGYCLPGLLGHRRPLTPSLVMVIRAGAVCAGLTLLAFIWIDL